MADKVRVDAECTACGATGIYCGFAEPKGVGVVCNRCGGSGKMVVKYTPFTQRKECSDINTVQLSRGSFIATGVGPTGTEVSYQEFLRGQMPSPTS